MKTKFQKNVKIGLAAVTLSSLMLMTGCGASNGSSSTTPGAAGVAGIGGGCVPLNTTSLVGFSATAMYMANPLVSMPIVQGGLVPSSDQYGGGQFGTMTVMPGTTTALPTATVGTVGTFSAKSTDGTVMSFTATATTPMTTSGTGYGSSYSNYPPNGQVNAMGTIQLSSWMQAMLVQTAMNSNSGFGSPLYSPGSYPTGYSPNAAATSNICVSNIALSMESGTPGTTYASYLGWGYIYFYLTGGTFNGQHGLAVYF